VLADAVALQARSVKESQLMKLSAVAIARGVALVLVIAASGCSSMDAPGPQNAAGLSPVGTVSMTQVIAVGASGGTGSLNFQGQSHPFKLVGGVTGGVGASDQQVSGEVYNLEKVSDFPGLYTESSGEVGLDTSSTSDLWLRNEAGVVLHLTGTQTGMILSLGREEVLIEML
jgi:hypothetical protein